MRLIKIKNFPDRTYAERAQQSLSEQGIPSVIQSPDAGVLGAGLPQGADLYVPEEFSDEANRMLNELFDGI